jgi:uncharacterized protein (UPF0335 family)
MRIKLTLDFDQVQDFEQMLKEMSERIRIPYYECDDISFDTRITNSCIDAYEDHQKLKESISILKKYKNSTLLEQVQGHRLIYG